MNSNVKNSFFYFIGYLISRLQAFFLLPILVNFLTKEKLGVYEILTSINVLVIAFSVLNLDSCLWSFYNEQKEIEKKSELTSTAFVFSFVFGFLILLGVYCFREFLLNSLRLSDYVNSFVLFLSVLNVSMYLNKHISCFHLLVLAAFSISSFFLKAPDPYIFYLAQLTISSAKHSAMLLIALNECSLALLVIK